MMSYRQWFVLLVIYIIFLLIGSVVFMYLEIDNELADREALQDLKKRVIDVVSSLENDSRVEVEEVVQEISDNCKHDFLHLVEDEPLTWSLWNSFFFTFTVITTIGFGHMSPSTSGGKIFCILYATVGVPLNGILIASLADLFSTKILNSRVKSRSKRYESWIGVAADAILYLLPGFIIFLVLPAAIFVAIEEGWNYLDSFYYAFITLTTIGFGDYVAGQQEMDHVVVWLYKIISFIWIIFGLGYIIMTITFIQKALKSKKVHDIERRLAKALKKQANKMNSNFQHDLKRMRTVVNAMAVMNEEPVHPEGKENGIDGPMKHAISQPTLAADNLPHSRSKDRVFLSHPHTPKHTRDKSRKIKRSVSDAALDKTETINQPNPLRNVNVFLDMVESLLQEHKAEVVQNADDEARQIVQATINSDSSSDSTSDKETDISDSTCIISKDLEAGYLNKGYIDDDNNAMYIVDNDLRKENVKSENSMNDRIQRKISSLLGIPDLKNPSMSTSTTEPAGEKVKTVSELLGIMEYIVCQPWHDQRQLQHFPINNFPHDYTSPKSNRQSSLSLPGHYRAAPEHGRPHLLDVLKLATPNTATEPNELLRLDSSYSNQDTITSNTSSNFHRRWSFASHPTLHLRHFHHQHSDTTGEEELFEDTKNSKHTASRLMPNWIHGDSDKENGDNSDKNNTHEYTHL